MENSPLLSVSPEWTSTATKYTAQNCCEEKASNPPTTVSLDVSKKAVVVLLNGTRQERKKVNDGMMPISQYSSDRSRTKLLNRLGLFQHQHRPSSGAMVGPSGGGEGTSSSSYLTNISRGKRSILGSFTPVKVQLKECRSDDDESSTELLSPRRGSAVQFDTTVSVVHIPSRYQYSPRIKKHIWADSFEIMEMAERNMMEFEHEGFDWRSVVLEDQFYVDSLNGELIHPCHLEDDSLLIIGGSDDGHDDIDGPSGPMIQRSCSFFS